MLLLPAVGMFLNHLATIVAQFSPNLNLSLAPLVLLSNAANKHPRSPFQNKTKSIWQLQLTSNIVFKLQISATTKCSYLKAKTQFPTARQRVKIKLRNFKLILKIQNIILTLET